MHTPNGDAVRPVAVYRDTFRAYRRHAARLFAVGAIIFVPTALLETVVGRLDAIDSATEDTFTIAAILAVVLGQVVFGLAGDVFYSGVVALVVAGHREGRASLRWIAAHLSFGTLIVIDVAYNLGIAVGLLLLVIPGILVFTWFALAAPLVELERLGARVAFARSRELVRGRFWTVLAILAPLTLAAQSLDDGLVGLAEELFGHYLVVEWLAESVASVLLSPLYAIPAVLITLRLIGHPRASGLGTASRLGDA